MDQEKKEELLQQFSEYLDCIDDEDDLPEDYDAFSLHAELAGLKNEVQIESRQVKTALDDFRSVFSTLEHTNRLLSQQLKESRTRESEAAGQEVKSLLILLLPLIERFMEATAHEPPKKGIFPFGFIKRQRQWIEAHRQGMLMLQDRLTAITGRSGVKVVNCMGNSFDPQYMQAMDIKYDEQVEEGVVLEELRPAFFLNGEVLHFAEVIVNRKEA